VCSPAGGCAGLRQQDPAALRLHQRQGRGLSVPGGKRQGFQYSLVCKTGLPILIIAHNVETATFCAKEIKSRY
jgi:hypothetical protein